MWSEFSCLISSAIRMKLEMNNVLHTYHMRQVSKLIVTP